MGQRHAQPGHVVVGGHAILQGGGRRRMRLRLPRLGRQLLEGALALLPRQGVQGLMVRNGE